MEYIIELFKIVIAPATMLAAVTYLIKKMLDFNGKKDLEKFKLELDDQLKNNREQIAADRKKSQFEYETKFSFYHNKLVEIITELYRLMVEMNRSMIDLTSPIQMVGGTSLKNKKLQSVNLFNELSRYYAMHRIYLPKDLCEMIERYLGDTTKAFYDFDTVQQGDSYTKDETGMWVESFKQITEVAHPLLSKIENYFRQIVGYYNIEMK